MRAMHVRQASAYHLQVLEEASSVSKDVSADVQTEVASAELQEAATIVNQHVNSLSDRVQHELTIEDRSAW